MKVLKFHFTKNSLSVTNIFKIVKVALYQQLLHRITSKNYLTPFCYLCLPINRNITKYFFSLFLTFFILILGYFIFSTDHLAIIFLKGWFLRGSPFFFAQFLGGSPRIRFAFSFTHSLIDRYLFQKGEYQTALLILRLFIKNNGALYASIFL